MTSPEITQADREVAENFASLFPHMTGTAIHNLAGILARHRAQSVAALQAEVERLLEENSTLAAGACINPGMHGLVGDDYGNSFCTAHEALLSSEDDLAASRALLSDMQALLAAERERNRVLREAMVGLLPINLGAADHLPDEAIIPMDVTIGEIRRGRAALAQDHGNA